MVGYRVGGASSIWMSFIKYTILTAARKLLTTFTVSNYPHQSLLCEEPTPPSDAARPNWRPFKQTQHPNSPIHDVASSNPSCVTYPTCSLRTWPSSGLFRSWRMLECKFTPRTKDAHGSLPPAITALVRRYGQLSWAPATASFILSRGWRLFYISPGGESSSSKRGSDVVLRTMHIVEPADRIPTPISRGCDLPMVSFLPQLKELWFWGMSAD